MDQRYMNNNTSFITSTEKRFEQYQNNRPAVRGKSPIYQSYDLTNYSKTPITNQI